MRRAHGVALIAVGVVLVVVGVIAHRSSDDNAPSDLATGTTAAAITTLAPATTTTTTTVAPATTSTTTTTAATAATAEPTTTTTTTATSTSAPETVEAFIEAYVRAAEADDVDFFFDRLHPIVLARTDADQCRAFIAADIVALEDYRLNGAVAEPRAVDFDTPDGTVTVDELYEAPVSFVFRGQSFDVVAAFAPVDGQMRWLTDCE